MKQFWMALAGVVLALALVGGPAAGAADKLKCGGTDRVDNSTGFDSPATYRIRAREVSCRYAKKFIKRYLETYNPPEAPFGFRCRQKAGSNDRTKEVCTKGDKRITFERDEIG